MSSKSRSIGQRLAHTRSPALRIEIAQDWSRNWQQDQEQVLSELDRAERQQDWRGVAAAAAQLRAITVKRFAALPGVITRLVESVQPPPAS